MCFTGILSVIFVAIFQLTTCEQYCIIPSHDEAQANSSCLTLNQFATSVSPNQSSVTVILEPGNHRLDVEFKVVSKSNFSIQSSGSTIMCESHGRFNVRNVLNVHVTSVTFIGCEGNEFSVITSQLYLENSQFLGNEVGNRQTSFLFSHVRLAIITNGTFLSNSDQYHFNNSSQMPGSIINTYWSTIVAQDCRFENNSVGVYGVINANRSTLTFTRCVFIGNIDGIVIAKVSNVYINDSNFLHNIKVDGSLLITVDTSRFIVYRTNFTGNTEGVLCVLSSSTLVNCTFNRNVSPKSNSPIQTSIIDVRANYQGILVFDSSDFTLSTCSFYSNEAENGGVVVLNNVTGLSDQTTVINNKALEGVFVLINTVNVTFNGETIFMNNLGSLTALESLVYMGGTVIFSNNTASSRDNDIIRGGAITVYFTSLYFLLATATFTKNHAVNGGAFHALVSNIYVIESELNITSNLANYSGGGVYLYQSSLKVYSCANIEDNEALLGGGINAVSSSIIVTSLFRSTFHSLTISRNTAILGGGIHFSTSARIFVFQIDPRPHDLTVDLTLNSAENGGAMYVSDETNLPGCDTETLQTASGTNVCFFQVVDLYPTNGNLSLEFESNKAGSSGSVLFGGLLDRCTQSPLASTSFFDNQLRTPVSQINGLTYFMGVSNIRNTSSLASDPVRVCFCFGGRHNCNKTQIDVFPQKGQRFNVSVAAVDHVGHSLSATVFTELQSSTGGLGEGQLSQMVDDVCTDLEFSVTSSNSEETIMIFADGPCGSANSSVTNINVIFSDCSCPIGFSVNYQQMSTCECVCNEQLIQFIETCTVDTGSFVKSGNFWIDYDNNTGYSVSSSCPLDYCLPFVSTLINLNQFGGANKQCASNRAGKLCGGCQQDHSLSLGQSGCIVCGQFWPINTVVYGLAVLIFGAVLMCVILFLNLTVAIGTPNGFIFAANILKAVFPFPRKHYPSYIISFLNLDLGFGVDFCFYDGLSTYAKTWFELVLPIYLHLLVALVIIACNYSSRFANYIGKRNPVETLVTLLFLSYSKLLQFIITVFSYGRITHPDGSEELVWLLDGRIGYNDPKHIAMIVVALVVVVIVFVYTFLLLFWQLLLKCPTQKLFVTLRKYVKLTEAIELYHVPFNNNHRYWTGLLLLIRFIVYIVAAFTSSSGTNTEKYLTIIFLLAVLTIAKSLQVRVYKRWPVDVLESILVSLTMVVTALVWYASSENNTNVSIATTTTLTVIMTCLIICVLLYHIKTFILSKQFESVPKKLTMLQRSVRSKFQKSNITHGISNTENHSEQQENVFDIEHPIALRHLNVDRFGSIVRVMDPPRENDYHQLNYQQELQRNRDEIHERKYVAVPVQPTFSVLDAPT